MKFREIPQKIGDIEITFSNVELLVVKLYKLSFTLFLLFLVFILPIGVYFGESASLIETMGLAGAWILGTLVADRLIRFFAKRLRNILIE